MRVHVSVCVRDRERERGAPLSVRASLCVSVCASHCVCVYVCGSEVERGEGEERMKISSKAEYNIQS